MLDFFSRMLVVFEVFYVFFGGLLLLERRLVCERYKPDATPNWDGPIGMKEHARWSYMLGIRHAAKGAVLSESRFPAPRHRSVTVTGERVMSEVHVSVTRENERRGANC